MNHKTRLFLFVSVLALAGLACATITGGDSPNDPAPVANPNQPPPANSNIIFQDDFSSTDSGWAEVTTSDRITTYAQDGYRILVAQPNFSYWAYAGQNFTDTSITVEATKIGGPDDNEIGVICRYSENDNGDPFFYMFVASSDGFFNIVKYENGDRTSLYDPIDGFWGESSAIKQGSATNVLRADCVGSTLTMYINGTQVASYTDSTLRSGDVGLLAGTFDEVGVDILFDNFVVRQP